MSKFFKIKGVAKGLDGLVVEGKSGLDWPNSGEQFIDVTCIYNTNIVFGDRVLKSPVTPGSLVLNQAFVEETTDPNMEFSTENPFGKYLYEGTYVKGDLNIAYTEFDNAIAITIFEKHGDQQKTLYSQNFFENTLTVMELIQSMLGGTLDPEDLVFELQRLKTEEK
jgi:hypothetical protein